MSGRPEQGPGRRVRARWLVGAAGVLTAALTVISLSPASAATTTKAQLTFTGVATSASPTGGSIIGIHPGDSVSFSTSTVPTAGLDKLGLGGLVSGLLGGAIGYQSTVDFSKLPGGAANTVLAASPSKTFTFANKGTYAFTYTIQSLTLLGIGMSSSDLNGNQLKGAGVALNASNQYVGQVVVADNPPTGGLTVQTPGLSLSPSLPVVGQLPTVTVPGITLPTAAAPSIPNLLPGGSSGSAGAASAPKKGTYTPPALSIPEQVVPKGNGNAVYAGGGSGGYYSGLLPDSQSQIGNTALPATGSGSGNATTAGQSGTTTGSNGQTVDLAYKSSNSSPAQLPVILAMLAILALALVGGTYARLFLMRKS